VGQVGMSAVCRRAFAFDLCKWRAHVQCSPTLTPFVCFAPVTNNKNLCCFRPLFLPKQTLTRLV
jgi:hypothetical protein